MAARQPTATGRAGRRRQSEWGAVTAEFAAVVPAVVILLVCALSGLQIAGQQVRLQDATADAVRSLARGDGTAAVSARLGHTAAGATYSISPRGDLVCIDVSAPATGVAGALFGIDLHTTGCALDGGR